MNLPTSDDHATTDRLSKRAHESIDQVDKTAGQVEERIRHGAAEA